MILRSVLQKLILLSILWMLVGCGLNTEPPEIGEILAPSSTTILVGDKVSLSIPASGQGLQFQWTAQKGTLSDPTQPAVVYTAPDTPGPDVVTVKISNRGGEITQNIKFNVIELPTPTVTNIATLESTPEPTPTTTLAPPPAICNHPAVTKNIFPQLANESGQFPFYGPLTEPQFSCQAVYDNVHNGPMAIHIKYENIGKNFGFWGFATPNGYDTSRYNQLCFWAYTQTPNQSFRLRMKDTTNKEDGIVNTLKKAGEWQQICTDLTEFSALGIQIAKMENVNLGFEQSTGSAEIWIAEFEFR